MENSILNFSMDGNRMIVDRQLYNCVDGEIKGIMRNASTNEFVIVRQYYDNEIRNLNKFKREIVSCFCSEINDNSFENEVEDAEVQSLNKFNKDESLKNFICPYTYYKTVKDNVNGVVTICKVTNDFVRKYLPVSKAIYSTNFPLNIRMAAIGNIIEICVAMKRHMLGLVRFLSPKSILVNTENGDVKVLLEECIDKIIDLKECRSGDYLLLANGNEPLGENMLNSYIAYTVFRMLCLDNPFDGRKALVDFPLISSRALLEMNSTLYGFAVNDNENKYSEYGNKDVFSKWKSLPGFARSTIEEQLDAKKNSEHSYEIENWIKVYRRLRDCLVYVNGQFRFCDPNDNNNVKFMELGDYMIPVWQHKAVYRYHIDEKVIDKSKNDVIVGVNSEGGLENLSDEQWVVEFEKKTSVIAPSHVLQPKVGMLITISDTSIRIISGVK